jgi:hypothetical protein
MEKRASTHPVLQYNKDASRRQKRVKCAHSREGDTKTLRARSIMCSKISPNRIELALFTPSFASSANSAGAGVGLHV